MTIKQRERQQMRISQRITSTIKRDGIGLCDRCYNQRDLFTDNFEEGDFRYCANCWAAFSDARREANHMPYGKRP